MKRRILSLALAAMMALTICSCKEEEKKENEPKPDDGDKPTEVTKYYDNAVDPIIFSSQEVDKVFNPFFSTAAADSNVVGMTQIGMLGNDKEGKVTYGEDEAVVVLDMDSEVTGTKDVDQITTYNFVLKNNVKFSNGSPLTMKDVLFNLYVYLDPVYTGSATIYSTDIVGLKEYRTQEADEKEQDSFQLQFQNTAETRINYLLQAADEIFEINKDQASLTAEKFKEALQVYTKMEGYENVVKDYEKAVELFKEELNTDYTNSMDSYSDISFKDDNDKLYKGLFTTDVEAFLYNEGYISFVRKEGKLESSLVRDPKELKEWTKEQAINTIIQDKVPNDIAEIVSYWNTGVQLMDYLVAEAQEEHFQNNKDRLFPNISGITFSNRTKPVTVNGKEYGVPEYNADGSVSKGNEVLTIKINNVDPKAIWNFAFTVAPMYYYSDAEHIAKFDYEKNFGVEFSSQTFMNNVVKDPKKLGVPVGAGPYKASKSSGGTEGVGAGDFYEKGVIYFEANEHYLMGEPKIKKLRYQVVPQNRMVEALENGEVDFVEPNAKPETIADLNNKKDKGIGNQSVQTSGYGYIGINAGKVPDLGVRQAIMHSINTMETVNYYKNTAKPIYRSMSLSSWAYPKGATAYYPYIGEKVPDNLDVVNPIYKDYIIEVGAKSGEVLTEAQQQTFIKRLVEDSGYIVNGNGVYQKGSDILKYTFTIAGEESDHPAWQALYHSSEILNKLGFQITVQTDANALKKLSTGALTVWAAAWGSTIDPDMYQVYHKDSNATSVLNWGYKQIKQNIGGKYNTELALVEELSELIDEGRSTTVEKSRAKIYSEALDIVMQLAIELPTYQRDDLFAYNVNKIDESTLTPTEELSPYQGLTSDIWNISLNVER